VGGIRTDEVLFRDTAHGFLAWALATLIVVTLLTIGSLTVAAAEPATTGGSVSREAAEAARKAAAAFGFYSSLSLLIGAFIASVAGALGGPMTGAQCSAAAMPPSTNRNEKRLSGVARR
jgi:hypothetical protein